MQVVSLLQANDFTRQVNSLVEVKRV